MRPPGVGAGRARGGRVIIIRLSLFITAQPLCTRFPIIFSTCFSKVTIGYYPAWRSARRTSCSRAAMTAAPRTSRCWSVVAHPPHYPLAIPYESIASSHQIPYQYPRLVFNKLPHRSTPRPTPSSCGSARRRPTASRQTRPRKPSRDLRHATACSGTARKPRRCAARSGTRPGSNEFKRVGSCY